MRTRFDAQMAQLRSDLLTMGALVETAIGAAITALKERDTALAKKIIASDNEIDDLEKQVESLCLKMILHQQPVAGDLRMISTALKIITDLERIGDHAEDISEITLILADKVYIGAITDRVSDMARATAKMVSESIDAYVQNNFELAQAVIKADDEVDRLFSAFRSDLIALIRDSAENGEQALDFLMIAKYFERIGDHAVNIAEWVIFSITGQHKNKKIL
jgi:phosphate transport system protein